MFESQSDKFEDKKGAIRVDNYWCHSTFLCCDTPSNFSTSNRESSPEQLPPVPDLSSQGDLLLTRHQHSEELAARFKALQRAHQVRLRALRYSSHLSNQHQRVSARHHIKSKMLQNLIHSITNSTQIHRIIQHVIHSNGDNDQVPLQEDRESRLDELQLVKRRRKSNRLTKPGMKFVTIFCDDQKVPLHPKIVDILSAAGENIVPESLSRLHAIAQQVEQGVVHVDKSDGCSCG